MYRVSLKSEFCKLSTEIVDRASKLVREVFSKEEWAACNVNGLKGEKRLNAVKMKLI